jgi:hypothetical protein
LSEDQTAVPQLIENNSYTELGQVTKRGSTPAAKESANLTKLTILDKKPTLEIFNAGSTFSLGMDDDEKLKLKFGSRELIALDKNSISFQNLIFSVNQPIIKGDYKSHGQKQWKIDTNSFFVGYPPTEITNCKGTTMFGGPGK